VIWEGSEDRVPAVIWDLSEGGAAIEVTDTHVGRNIEVLLHGGGIPEFLPMRIIKSNPGTIRGVLLHARFVALNDRGHAYLERAIAGWRELHEERQAWLASRTNDLRRVG
jgi:hypothetical protein